MKINLETAILDAIYCYFESHPGSPEMTLRELYEAVGISPSDNREVAEVRRRLFSLKKKDWVEYKILSDGSGGLVGITLEGIRVAKDSQGPTLVPPQPSPKVPEQRGGERVIHGMDVPEPCPLTLEDLVRRDTTCADLIHRDDVLGKIKECFTRSASRQHLIVLHGQPMVGKTKILERLSVVLGDEYVPLRITGQGVGLEALGRLDAFVFELAIQLTTKFTKWAQDHGVAQGLSKPVWDDFRGGRGKRAFYTCWDNLKRDAGERQTVVMIDEIEHLLDEPDKLNPRILIFLDDFLHNPENGYFVIAGSERIRHASNRQFSRLIARGHPIRVRYYDEETIALVLSMFQDYFTLDKDFRQCLLTHCDGHPRFLPVVYEATRSLGKQSLDQNDVEPVLERVIERTDDALWVLWQRLSTDEYAVVWLISQDISARASELEYSVGDLVELASQLPTAPKADYESLIRGVTYLEQRQWAEWKNRATGQFHFKLGILPWWVRRHYVSSDRVKSS